MNSIDMFFSFFFSVVPEAIEEGAPGPAQIDRSVGQRVQTPDTVRRGPERDFLRDVSRY